MPDEKSAPVTQPPLDLRTWTKPVIAQRLRELLERVEAGKVLAIGLVVVGPDRDVGTSWGRDTRAAVADLVYGCENLRARLLGITMDDLDD